MRSHSEWLADLDDHRRKRWEPLLRRLTPEQIEKFHEDRRAMATTLPLDAPISFSAGPCERAERDLFERWKEIALTKGQDNV
jgi:hypothetical protein